MNQAPPPEAVHGRRLTRQEYESAVVKLFQEAGGIGNTPEQRRQLRHRELDLAIDYRLGVDFPTARREALWQVQEEIERRRMRMLAKNLLVRLLPRLVGERRAAALAKRLMADYAKVLSSQEMLAFLGPLDLVEEQ